jgi:ankyrin repeat protein
LKSIGHNSNSLHEAYDGAVERMNAQLSGDRALARRVLSWIIYAQRPLTTIELLDALAVNIGDTCLDRDNILDIDDVILVCVGLVAVDQQSDIIRLVHHTAEEYFEQRQEALSQDSLNEISSTCLTYLLFTPFRSGHCLGDSQLEYRLERNPFLNYAAHFWSRHAQMVQEQQVQDLATSFLENPRAVESAVQVASVPESRYKFKGYSQRKVPRGLEGLHVTAMLGLLDLSRMLLSRPKSSINTKDTQGRTPLSWASANGHQAVVHLLIEAGADLNAQKLEGMTALHEAAKNGHEAVVRRLLDANAQVDTQDRDGMTALHMAADNGREAVVKMLLDAHAQVNFMGKEDYTVLSLAINRRDTAIIKLLLDAGADIDFMGYGGDTPLYIAASEGYDDVVELLLDAGADVNGARYPGGMPLQGAVEQGHGEITEILLKAGADIHARDYNGERPLDVAARMGDELMVELLLIAGAELDDEDILDGLDIDEDILDGLDVDLDSDPDPPENWDNYDAHMEGFRDVYHQYEHYLIAQYDDWEGYEGPEEEEYPSDFESDQDAEVGFFEKSEADSLEDVRSEPKPV